MNAIVTSAVLAAALLWATESIALEPKQPPSLPTLDFSCYISHSFEFTRLQSTGSELTIGGDIYEKPLYRFTTVGESMLKVFEFSEVGAVRKYYWKSISELSFDSTGSIFGWPDNEALGLRIFMVNQRDRLVSVLELPPSSQTAPLGALRALKCNDAAKTAPPPQDQEMRSERAKVVSPIPDQALRQTSTAMFLKRLPVPAQGSVSSRSGPRAMVFKAPPLDHQAGR